MKISRKTWLAGTSLAVALAGVSAPRAIAQGPGGEAADIVTVTGSLIARDGNLVETSPVTSVGAEAFDIQGTLRVEDLINNLPQAFAAQGQNIANGASGTASINLRGLGSSRTLTLMNGRRLPYGSTNIYAPDVNFIPAALVQRVDVLTGGASATYGADAVAGVVNFVLDTGFDGFRIDVNGAFFQHNNDNPIQSLLSEFSAVNPDQFDVPTGNTTGGGSFDATAIWGGELDGGRGSFQSYLGYQHTEPLLQGEYDYGQCALGLRNSGQEFSCVGSPTNAVTNLLDLDTDYFFPNGSQWARVDPATGEFIDRDFVSDTFNFNPFNHYQRPNERFTGGVFVEYNLSDRSQVYSEFQFMSNRTNAQIAPSGVFGYGVGGDAGGINCDNPFLSAQQVDFLCREFPDGSFDADDDGNPRIDGLPDRIGYLPDGIVPNVLLLRRNVEGGPRNEDIRHTTFRGVLGVRGDFGASPFDYDVYAQYANTHRTDVYNNDLSIRRLSRALYAVDDGSGNVVCNINADTDPSNDDPACVPYDILSGAGPDPAAVEYIVSPLHSEGNTEQWVISALITGDLKRYGFRSPYSRDGIAVAVGTEYREDYLDRRPDANYQAGDGAGQGGPRLPLRGRLYVVDIFGEMNVPLLQGQPFAELLGFDAAYRFSTYENFNASSYKIGADWAPTNDIRFRGSYQRAVRAPNIFELFAEQQIGLFDLTAGENGLFDPCASDGTTEPAATQEQCARTGVTTDQYGNIADNPAGQFNTLTGGNPELEPETSDTLTLGAVFTPTLIRGDMTISVDYFDISVTDFVGTVPQGLSLDQCLDTGDPFFCSLINRGVGGTLWAGQTGFITATNLNTGELSTSGVDINASWGFDLSPRTGGVDLSLIGTWLNDLVTQPLPSSGADQIYDCAGLYAAPCGIPNPEWRHQARLTWISPSDFSLSLTWRHIGEVTVAQASDQAALADSFAAVNQTLGAQNYFDIAGIYPVNDTVTLRAGINNVLDNDPPLSTVVGTGFGNGNTFPQVYDAMGRYLFFGAQFDF